MRQRLKLLILAGSAEARSIAQTAAGAGAEVQAWVTEPPRGPNPMPVPCDLVSFDDPGAIAAQMRGFDAVLDASHGFDGVMTTMGYAAARQAGLPFLSVQRPPWQAEAVNWRTAHDIGAALPMITAGARVFSATGWASLPEYAGFNGSVLMLRQTSRHDRMPPFDFVKPIFGDPPFSTENEIALFAELSVDLLICRNLGGTPSRPKLEAALTLGLEVILIDCPAPPAGLKVVTDIAPALEWLATL